MLCKMAEIDLAQLRKNGHTPTDAEIIELNDLAIRIESGQNTTPYNHPRVGFAGNVILHEPTIGGIEWWNYYGSDSAFTNKGRLMTYFFMLANCRRLDYLNRFQTPKEIRHEVRNWKKSIQATEDELWRALMWVRFATENTNTENAKLIQNTLDSEESMNNLWGNVIIAAGVLGLSPNDLRTITQMELLNTLIQANLQSKIPMKKSVAQDYISYTQLIKKIESRDLEKNE